MHILFFGILLYLELAGIEGKVFATIMLKIMSSPEQGLGAVREDNRYGNDFFMSHLTNGNFPVSIMRNK